MHSFTPRPGIAENLVGTGCDHPVGSPSLDDPKKAFHSCCTGCPAYISQLAVDQRKMVGTKPTILVHRHFNRLLVYMIGHIAANIGFRVTFDHNFKRMRMLSRKALRRLDDQAVVVAFP